MWTKSKKQLMQKIVAALNLEKYFSAFLSQEDMSNDKKNLGKIVNLDMSLVVFLDNDYEAVSIYD
jgi:hypothetical protein